MINFSDGITDVLEMFNVIVKPSGKSDSPARTCKELMQLNTALPDGMLGNSHLYYMANMAVTSKIAVQILDSCNFKTTNKRTLGRKKEQDRKTKRNDKKDE